MDPSNLAVDSVVDTALNSNNKYINFWNGFSYEEIINLLKIIKQFGCFSIEKHFKFNYCDPMLLAYALIKFIISLLPDGERSSFNNYLEKLSAQVSLIKYAEEATSKIPSQNLLRLYLNGKASSFLSSAINYDSLYRVGIFLANENIDFKFGESMCIYPSWSIYSDYILIYELCSHGFDEFSYVFVNLGIDSTYLDFLRDRRDLIISEISCFIPNDYLVCKKTLCGILPFMETHLPRQSYLTKSQMKHILKSLFLFGIPEDIIKFQERLKMTYIDFNVFYDFILMIHFEVSKFGISPPLASNLPNSKPPDWIPASIYQALSNQFTFFELIRKINVQENVFNFEPWAIAPSWWESKHDQQMIMIIQNNGFLQLSAFMLIKYLKNDIRYIKLRKKEKLVLSLSFYELGDLSFLTSIHTIMVRVCEILKISNLGNYEMALSNNRVNLMNKKKEIYQIVKKNFENDLRVNIVSEAINNEKESAHVVAIDNMPNHTSKQSNIDDNYKSQSITSSSFFKNFTDLFHRLVQPKKKDNDDDDTKQQEIVLKDEVKLNKPNSNLDHQPKLWELNPSLFEHNNSLTMVNSDVKELHNEFNTDIKEKNTIMNPNNDLLTYPEKINIIPQSSEQQRTQKQFSKQQNISEKPFGFQQYLLQQQQQQQQQQQTLQQQQQQTLQQQQQQQNQQHSLQQQQPTHNYAIKNFNYRSNDNSLTQNKFTKNSINRKSSNCSSSSKSQSHTYTPSTATDYYASKHPRKKTQPITQLNIVTRSRKSKSPVTLRNDSKTDHGENPFPYSPPNNSPIDHNDTNILRPEPFLKKFDLKARNHQYSYMSESDIDYRRQKPNQHMPTGDMISIDDLLVSDSIEPDNNTFILSKNSQRQIFSHQYFQVNEFIDIYYNNQIVAKVPNGFTTTKIIFNNEEALMITLSVSLKTESHCIFQLESKTEPIATFASGNFVDLIRQFEEFIDTNKQKDPLFPTFPKNKSIFHFFDINLWNIEGNKAVFA